jgi:hypothetical protein
MQALTIIYWTKVLWGIGAGLLSAFLAVSLPDFNLTTAISIALLVYVISYYVYKPILLSKIEKTTKIFTTGVGAYFLTWVVSFGLFFTMLSPVLVITSPTPGTSYVPGNVVTISVRLGNQLGVRLSGANVTAKSPTKGLIVLNETSQGTYVASYNVTPSDPTGNWQITVTGLINDKQLSASITVQLKSKA